MALPTVRIALLLGVSTFAVPGAPVQGAARILFSTGTIAGRALPRGSEISGLTAISGGITQIRTADGGTLSFVGDARFAIDGEKIVVETGRFTAGGTMTIASTVGGTVRLRGADAAASLSIGADGIRGRPLAGMLDVASGGATRSFEAGQSFATSNRGASAIVTAGAQPVSVSPAGNTLIDQPTSVAQVLNNASLISANSGAAGVPVVQNPDLPTIATASPAELLRAVAADSAGLGFDAPAALIEAQRLFLAAGGRPGTLDATSAAQLLAAYVAFLQAGGQADGFADAGPAVLKATLDYLRAAGVPGTIAADQRSILVAYLAFLDSGGVFGTLPAPVVTPPDPEPPVVEPPVVTPPVDSGPGDGAANPAPPTGGNGDSGVTNGSGGSNGSGGNTGGGSNTGTGGAGGTGSTGGTGETGGAGGSGTGTPPPANSGAGALATASNVAASLRASTRTLSGPATERRFGNDGGLDSLLVNGNLPGEKRGTATAADVYANGVVAIGRWTNGALDAGSSQLRNVTLSASQGVPYYLTLPAGTLPVAGRADYVLAGATKPVMSNGSVSPGTVVSAKLAVTYGYAARVAFEGSLTMPETGGTVTYDFTTSGGVADPSKSNVRLRSNGAFSDGGLIVTGTGAACTASCSGIFEGRLAGTDQDGAALTYSVNNAVIGAMAFSRSGQSGIERSVAAGTASGSSAGSGLANGIMPVLIVGNGAANASLSTISDCCNSTVRFETGGAPVAVGQTTLVNGNGGSAGTTDVPSYERKTATVAEAAAGAGWTIGRWNGGSVAVAGSGDLLYSSTQGLHVITLAAPTGVLPEGIARYSLAAATRPVFADGRETSAATFTGDLAIAFGTTAKLGLDATIAIADSSGAQSYALLSPGGGAATPAVPISVGSNGVAGTTSWDVASRGTACPAGTNSCRVSIGVATGGDAAKVVGLTYMLTGTAAGQTPPALSGAAVFTQSSVTPRDDAAGSDLTGDLIFAGSSVGSDYRGGYLVRLTGDGTINRFAEPVASGEKVLRGTNAVYEQGKANSAGDMVAWTRWGGGTSEGTFYGPAAMANARTAKQGFHIIVGTPAAGLPASGSAQYRLAGATAPTIGDGSLAPGTIGNAALGVDFASRKVGFGFDVGIGGHSYRVATAGGAADPGNGGFALADKAQFFGQLTVAVGGPACTGTSCTAFVNGQLFGAGGSLAGIAYRIQGPAIGLSPTDVTGVAAFAKN